MGSVLATGQKEARRRPKYDGRPELVSTAIVERDKEPKIDGIPAAALRSVRVALPMYRLRTGADSDRWPPWISAVAGDVIKDWKPRRANTFEKLEKIGQGTYSNVYKARDLITGKVVALKKVRFDNYEPESVRFMAREILVLGQLNHPNIIKL